LSCLILKTRVSFSRERHFSRETGEKLISIENKIESGRASFDYYFCYYNEFDVSDFGFDFEFVEDQKGGADEIPLILPLLRPLR
jgi:hypothetical protein